MDFRTSFWREGFRDFLANWVNPKTAFWVGSLSWLSLIWSFVKDTCLSVWDTIAHLVDGGCVHLNPVALLSTKLFASSDIGQSLTTMLQSVLQYNNVSNLPACLWRWLGVSWWFNSVSLYISIFVTLILASFCIRGVRWVVSTIMDAIPVA